MSFDIDNANAKPVDPDFLLSPYTKHLGVVVPEIKYSASY